MTDVRDKLRQGLKVAASGELSLDKDKARAKLRMFRLPDPHFYVLQFVRTASVLGAERIRFDFGVGGMKCEFDAQLPDGAFENFWDAGFRARRTSEDVALHNLALGIGSAQALTPGSITIASGEQQIEFRGDNEVVSRIAPVDGTVVNTLVEHKTIVEFGTELFEIKPLKDGMQVDR